VTAESVHTSCLRCLGLPSARWEGHRQDPSHPGSQTIPHTQSAGLLPAPSEG